MGAEKGGALERSEGQAQQERVVAVRRAAAAAVHSARRGSQAGRAAAGRADFGARSDFDGENRGTDQRAQGRLHAGDRYPQHAAGGALLGLYGLHVSGGIDRIRRNRPDFHVPGEKRNAGLHHRKIWLKWLASAWWRYGMK